VLEEPLGVREALEDDLDHILGSDGLAGHLLQFGQATLDLSLLSVEPAKAVGQELSVLRRGRGQVDDGVDLRGELVEAGPQTRQPRAGAQGCLTSRAMCGGRCQALWSLEAPTRDQLTVSWSHRNRLGTWSYADSGATDEAEDGTEYDILVYGELGTLVHTETGLTGTSWTYLEADEIAESGLGRLSNHLRVRLRTWGDSRTHEAIREIEWEFERT